MQIFDASRRTLLLAATTAALTAATWCNLGHGALVTDFSKSYAQYQAQRSSASDFDDDLDIDGGDFLVWQRGMGRINQANKSFGDGDADRVVSGFDFRLWSTQFATTPASVPDSVAFKLYFDPDGIYEGQVTVVVDVPHGTNDRFALGAGNGLIAQDTRYNFFVESEDVFFDGVRDRYEANVHFVLKLLDDLPIGPVTLFGYQVRDLSPGDSVAPVETSFQFDDGDYIVLRNEAFIYTTILDDDLQDTVVPLVATLVLDVDVASGLTSVRNPTGLPITFDYYEILSAAGSLNPAGWTSFDDLEGDPPGAGWEEASAANSHVLSEGSLAGSVTLNPDEFIELGAAFNVSGVTTHDLRFRYVSLPQGFVYGVVNFIGGAPVTAVPEPGSVALAGVGLAVAASRRRRTPSPTHHARRPRAAAPSRCLGRRLIAVIAIVAGALGGGSATAHGAIFIADFVDGTVGKYTNRGTVVNPTLISGLNVGGQGPGGVAIAGGVLYVGGYGGLGLRTYTLNGTPINAPLVSTSRGDVTISGGVLYLSHDSDALINAYTPAGSLLSNYFIGAAASDVVVVGGRMYSAHRTTGRIGVYNPTTGAAINSSLVTGLTTPVSIAYARQQLFVADQDLGTIGQYDALTGAAINPALISGLNGPRSIAVSGSHLVVACNDQTLRIYDFISGAEVRPPVVTTFDSPFGLAITPYGDYDEDGDVDATDFLTLTTHLHTDVSALTLDQAAALGDLTEDRRINGQDFFEFRLAYDDLNGPGAFVAMLQGVPEPSAAILLTSAGLALAGRRRRRPRTLFATRSG